MTSSLQQQIIVSASSSFTTSSSLKLRTPFFSSFGQGDDVETLDYSQLRMRKQNYCYYNHAKQPRKAKVKFVANAAESELAGDPKPPAKSLLAVIYKYSRFYTIQGTILAIICISLLAVQNLSDFTPSFFFGVLQGVLGGFFANMYVTAINQISDIEIDKVNKPYLALPSGDLSVRTAILLTATYVFLGFCVGWNSNSWPLKVGLLSWYAVGAAYSVHMPLLRWKKTPALAAFTLWVLLGFNIPILFHLHAQMGISGRTLLLSKHAIFVFGVMSIYGIVIALLKDIPDVEGDKIGGVNTFALQFGQKQVFWTSIWLLEMVYGIAIVIGLSSPRVWIRSIMVIGHGIFGFVLWRKANLVDLKSTEATESFYQFIWKLYYVQYLLVPMLRF